jgi:hypothetical protein
MEEKRRRKEIKTRRRLLLHWRRTLEEKIRGYTME